jgi:Protein of unknown function (DUF3568)
MRFIRILLLLFVTLAMTGCAAIATGLVSVGAGFGVSHHISGTSQRTFSLPLARVKTAAIAALKRMGMRLDSAEKTKSGEILKATASGRKIEVELEEITPTATRMSSVAMKNGGWILDSATGQEIVAQTEKILGRQSTTPPARVPAS